MRLIAIAAAALLALAGVAQGGHDSTAQTPVLRLVKLTLLGSGFQSSERVRVTFVATTRAVRNVHTSQRGSFSTPVPLFGGCSGPVMVKALGAHGDQATLKIPRRACMPQ
jgi:hypothetical protein